MLTTRSIPEHATEPVTVASQCRCNKYIEINTRPDTYKFKDSQVFDARSIVTRFLTSISIRTSRFYYQRVEGNNMLSCIITKCTVRLKITLQSTSPWFDNNRGEHLSDSLITTYCFQPATLSKQSKTKYYILVYFIQMKIHTSYYSIWYDVLKYIYIYLYIKIWHMK